jgi:hypothetical protein
MHGALAESYGDLIQQMWDSGTSLANPEQLKVSNLKGHCKALTLLSI